MASVEAALPVSATTGMPRRRSVGTNASTSAVSPLFDKAIDFLADGELHSLVSLAKYLKQQGIESTKLADTLRLFPAQFEVTRTTAKLKKALVLKIPEPKKPKPPAAAA
jgi:hypothetical protein